eukprot:scpid81042/ scgid33588/ 
MSILIPRSNQIMAGTGEVFSWSEKLTKDFLEIYSQYQEKFSNVNFKSFFLWQEIARLLRESDADRNVWPSDKQCNNRFKSLKSSSQKYLDSLKETGAGKKRREPPFHKEIMDLIGSRSSVVPPSIASSGSIVSSIASSQPISPPPAMHTYEGKN